MGFLNFLSSLDPTKVQHASDAGVQAATSSIQTQQQQLDKAAQASAAMQANPTAGAAQDTAASVNRSVVRDVAPSGATASQVQLGPLFGGAKVDNAMTAQGQNQQNFGLALLQQQATGQAPSAAQMQMQQGQEAAIKASAAQAASLRGNQNAGTVMKQAMDNQAQTMQATNQQTAVLRAQEQAAAQQALVSGQATARGQDITQATTDAQLKQQAALQGQSDTLAAGTTNATLGTQVALGNQSAKLTADLADQGADLSVASQNASLAQQTGLANQSADLQARQIEANKEMTIKQLQAGLNGQVLNSQTSVMGINQGADSQSSALRAGMVSSAIGAAGAMGAAGLTSGAAGAGSAGAAATPTIGQLGAGDGMAMTPAQANLGISNAEMVSDKRAKINIKDGGKEARSFLEALEPATYDYKDPAAHGEGKQLSVMAQDLEKTPAGKAMVRDHGDLKTVDYGRGFGQMLAAMADMHDRLKKVEGKKVA